MHFLVLVHSNNYLGIGKNINILSRLLVGERGGERVKYTENVVALTNVTKPKSFEKNGLLLYKRTCNLLSKVGHFI